MRLRHIAVVLASALLSACSLVDLPTPPFTPWGTIYGAARDERSVQEILFDKAISTQIKGALLNRSGGLGLNVKVYSFRRRVTLLGQLADDDLKAFALATAWEADLVRSVSAHWVPPEEGGGAFADLEIAARLRAALVADENISATQIELEVFGGQVFLVGMVRGQKDVDRAVAVAQGIAGVTGVTSLLLPSDAVAPDADAPDAAASSSDADADIPDAAATPDAAGR